jgi:hypothetical protein
MSTLTDDSPLPLLWDAATGPLTRAIGEQGAFMLLMVIVHDVLVFLPFNLFLTLCDKCVLSSSFKPPFLPQASLF